MTATNDQTPDVPAAEADPTPETPAEETPATDVTADVEATPDVADEASAPAAIAAVEASGDEAPAVESPAPDAPVEDDTVTAAAPAPAPVPSPSRAIPVPTRPRSAAPVAAPAATTEPWGRVEEDGTVSVRESAGWRIVGQYPDGSTDEALAYFERKYADLAGEVVLLEARHRRGGAGAADLSSTAAAVRERVVGAAAVGDLEGLAARLDALVAALSAATEVEAQQAKEAVDEAIAERTAIVEKAEALAARDPQSVQWKQTTADIATLFDQWQNHQQNGPRLPRAVSQKLWGRFRDARATIDRHRRAYFADLDETHKSARDSKSRLVERAEALAPRGEDGIAAYRTLLDEWKSAGRAGKKIDDALWARFKAAGDVLYGARSDRESVEAEESKERIELKRALLTEAAAVPGEKDLAAARQLLTGLQRRWDEIGRIFPRDKERQLDDELRRIEQGVRDREQTHWRENNPETKARANDMTRQLEDAIAKLEDDLAAAKATGDSRKVKAATEALEARRGWLRAIGG
ncbi:MAG: DUF349 domain-containing protein [Microbacterium ginsengisoli]|uniref:DUF349 domain-containing protein n=1 Tax=Microbacterium TaxID=33882 RepID=UPI0009E79B4C|nr:MULTISPECIES: DUF349 domain-containing protein [unclassified Microbacterium]MBN9197427.1 DUF349 domain-containing protein [Microbacterium ginsengisoli]